MKKYTMIVFVLMFFISCNPQIKRITKTSENNEFDNSKTDVLFCENEIKIDKDNVSDFFIFDEKDDLNDFIDETIEKNNDSDFFVSDYDFSDAQTENGDNNFIDDFENVDLQQNEDSEAMTDNDNFNPQNECETNDDCDFGYSCNKSLEPFFCEYANKCETDEDCSNIQKCEIKENWKECVLDTSPAKCQADEDCNKGEYCKQIFPGFKKCISKNKCETDEECPKGYSCKFNDEFYECKKDNPCQTDEDCGFGYVCKKEAPQNICEYVNECVNDEDCKNLESCVVSGNHTICKFLGGKICSKDSDCPAGFYCNKTFGFAGKCETKNQCYKNSDCKDGFICKNNGSFNECIPKDTNSCFVDAQCKNGLKCINNKCMPSYAEMCPEIAGFWTVWFSTIPLIKQSEKYEFIPKKECSGDIKKETSSLNDGTFQKTSENNFNLKMYFFMNCSAKITLNSIMTIDCKNNQTAQLGRVK
jgi:hypothetical protein